MNINPQFRPDSCEDFRAVESPEQQIADIMKKFDDAIDPLKNATDPMTQQEAIVKALCAGLDAVYAAMERKPIK